MNLIQADLLPAPRLFHIPFGLSRHFSQVLPILRGLKPPGACFQRVIGLQQAHEALASLVVLRAAHVPHLLALSQVPGLIEPPPCEDLFAEPEGQQPREAGGAAGKQRQAPGAHGTLEPTAMALRPLDSLARRASQTMR